MQEPCSVFIRLHFNRIFTSTLNTWRLFSCPRIELFCGASSRHIICFKFPHNVTGIKELPVLGKNCEHLHSLTNSNTTSLPNFQQRCQAKLNRAELLPTARCITCCATSINSIWLEQKIIFVITNGSTVQGQLVNQQTMWCSSNAHNNDWLWLRIYVNLIGCWQVGTSV